jgi:NAD(P)-dependent dehydrogenase (short-subunit alcohol dehydrogenase family)
VDGKVAIVTGGASGIGAACAATLAREGAKRRAPDLAARPLRPEALSDLIDRRPHLLRPLIAQILPPRLPSTDPAKHLGIDLSWLRTVEDVQQMLAPVLAAVARGEIAPAEAAREAAPRSLIASEIRRKSGVEPRRPRHGC